jgi:flavin reductase (DIM6/NTAB) family NADH-FMN oxidoreductase RutF
VSVGPDEFRRALGAAPTPVAVLTIVDANGADRGMTVSAFTSVSLVPPLVLVCVGDDATLAAAMRTTTHFALSVLAAPQEMLSERFADREERGFDGVPLSRGPSGTALLGGAAAHVECRVVARQPGGDHTIVVGEVQFAKASGVEPLVHLRGEYRSLAP